MTTRPARQAPHHNTLTCYTNYQCRLPACVERYNARNRERLRAKKAGTYNALIDATPVRRHILSLQAAGVSTYAIAAATGIPTQTVLDFIYPQASKRRGRRYRTSPEMADKILAVRPEDRTKGRIDPTGTRRRIQALVALGWPVRDIARHAGLACAGSHDFLKRPYVYASTAKAIAEAYDWLRARRPEKNGVTKQHAAAAKNRAARNRWAPPKYWDQHPGAIDDHSFVPTYGVLRAEILAREAAWLMADGLHIDLVAKRLGKSRFYIDRALREHPQDTPEDEHRAADSEAA